MGQKLFSLVVGIKSKKSHIKTSGIYAIAVASFYGLLSLLLLMPGRALALAADPNISGGGSVTGAAGHQVVVSPGTPIQVSGTGSTVNVQVNVASGYLTMTTTTNLTFFTDPSIPSKNLVFKGAITDVNNGLASLKYMNPNPGNFPITAYVLPENMFYNPVNGHYYKSVSGGSYNFATALSGSAAASYQGISGHLAAVDSEQENTFIYENVNQENWIAASDQETEGTFKIVAGPDTGSVFWSGGVKGDTGAPVDSRYNNWAIGEPNDSGSNEDCGYIFQGSPEWNDFNCGTLLGAYTIEFEDASLTAPPSVTATMSISESTVPVSSCDDLQFIANHQDEYANANMVQTQDIDCDGSWISPLFKNSPMTGSYDGQGFSIYNFSIDDGDYSSLFGVLEGASVVNLSVDGDIYGGYCIGSIAGSAHNSSFTNNSSGAYLELYSNSAGGIVGCVTDDEGSSSITNNSFDGSINANSGETSIAGGIIGQFDATESTVDIKNNSVNHSQWGTGYNAGGIIGQSDVYNNATVNVTDNTVSSSIDNYQNSAGGIIGNEEGYGQSIVNIANNTISSSTISSNNVELGGIIGYSYLQDQAIVNVNNNTIDENTYVETNGYEAAGVIGYLETYDQTKATINDNTVNAHFTFGEGNNYGGIVGEADIFADPSIGTNLLVQGNTVNSYVSGYSNLGGLIGYLYGTGSFNLNTNNVQNDVGSYGGSAIGGLVGYTYISSGSEADVNIAIYNNTISGEVYSAYEHEGGLLGDFNVDPDSGAAIKVNITGNETTSYVGDSTNSVGGLIGAMTAYGNTTTVTINKNTTSGETWHGQSYAGGLVGTYFTVHATTNIVDNVTTGSVTGPEGSAGLIGRLQAYWSDTNVLIKNNSTSGTIAGDGGYLGGLIGYLDVEQESALVNVLQNSATGYINGSNASFVGGLIGDQYAYQGRLNVEQNISSGAVTGQNNVGGLIGASELEGNDTDNKTLVNILNNYSTGNVEAGGQNTGGLMGLININTPDADFGQTELENNYASGNVVSYGSYTGGLIGIIVNNSDNSEDTVMLNDSFSVGSVSGNNLVAGFVGLNENPINSNNNYYDNTTAGQPDCYNGESIDCTSINTTEAPAADYFKKNSTNAPLNTWNFINVWGATEDLNGGLPCLQWENANCAPKGDADGDGVTNEVENAGPNNGDANDDGIKDYVQQNLSSLVDAVTGKYTLVQSSCAKNGLVSSSAESTLYKDSGYEYPAGLTSFTSTCASDGATADITLYYYGSYDLSKLTLRKYNPETHVYTTVENPQLSTVTIGGQSVLKIQYSVTDGGQLDLDGTANGVIVDPVGIATLAVIAPNTGL